MNSAVVTGASRGIGLAIVKTLMELDFLVYGLARDFSETSFSHDNFKKINCDITKSDTLQTIIKRLIKEDKNISLLVNNAGLGYFGPHEQLDAKKIHEMVSVNLEAPLILTSLLLRTLKQNNGTVINISSVTAKKPSPIGLAYSATKAGLTHFSEGLFEEARKYGVKPVTIHADMTKTSFYENASFTTDDSMESYIEETDIAEAVRFILTGRSGTVVTDITIRPQLHRIKRK